MTHEPCSFAAMKKAAHGLGQQELSELLCLLVDAMDELQKQHLHLRNEFERMRSTSVPIVSDEQRRAGRFLRKGRHKGKPHEWVVENDPQYVIFCDERSAALGLGFTSEEVSVANIAIVNNPSLRDRRFTEYRDAAISATGALIINEDTCA